MSSGKLLTDVIVFDGGKLNVTYPADESRVGLAIIPSTTAGSILPHAAVGADFGKALWYLILNCKKRDPVTAQALRKLLTQYDRQQRNAHLASLGLATIPDDAVHRF